MPLVPIAPNTSSLGHQHFFWCPRRSGWAVLHCPPFPGILHSTPLPHGTVPSHQAIFKKNRQWIIKEPQGTEMEMPVTWVFCEMKLCFSRVPEQVIWIEFSEAICFPCDVKWEQINFYEKESAMNIGTDKSVLILLSIKFWENTYWYHKNKYILQVQQMAKVLQNIACIAL